MYIKYENYKSKEKDIVLAKFINYMKIVFNNQRINYFRDLKIQNSWEEELKENDIYFDKYTDLDTYDLQILNEKEKYLFELHYKNGLPYSEISKITGEKIDTLKKRRTRALRKLNFRMGEWY